jgi:glycine dehydrogenase
MTTFADRHIGTDSASQQIMLQAVGYSTVDELMDAAVPSGIRAAAAALSLPEARSEREALADLRVLAGRNRVRRSMIGIGYHGTITPAVIQRNVLENPSWYTAYTPYQPEISQGRLEALINFQTMVADLTGLATANASMLDEATAVVEGMLLARRASGSASNVFLVDSDALPQTLRLLAHRAEPLGISLEIVDFSRVEERRPEGDASRNRTSERARVEERPAKPDASRNPLPDAFGAFIQYPGASGRVWDPRSVIESVHASGGLVVVAADLLALTLLASPGELGADVAVGTSQRFGVPMGFGGPHAGYLAVKAGLERQMPGRLVGVSVDAAGHPAYRLSLQTREQHIRREKATSNICTAQVLLAVMASMYAVYHGASGLKSIAHQVNRLTRLMADALGDAVVHAEYFDTLTVNTADAAAVVAEAAGRGYLLRQVDDTHVGVSLDETTTAHDVETVLGAFGIDAQLGFKPTAVGIPETLVRTSRYLEHPVFSAHRSETTMMRYLKHLADKDYALDRGMIPLGSCTMKLNAATEMAAVTWPEFADIHPFAPDADTEGYRDLIAQLEGWLAELTGYDAVSLQPNAGSQGELAGLLAIRGYHLANGDSERTVCLIPSSAHGTNAASAVLAGMKVVVVACDSDGNVDLDDLRAKISDHSQEIAALMVTYPSTHGVYEPEILQMATLVHDAGGQVYIDGANLNALLGYARFGDIGGDVSHLNLHKTFCIPHGGGGPGVGPVAAKAHLAPYLPKGEANPVSAAPYGSPSILPISWAYVRMMGPDGLTRATSAAVLAANYVAARLREHFPVLYAGENGLVAHECILDLRPLRDATGVTVDDVAKRLIDYGFHAPTMSFPVAGTLMVEPTESEDLGEIDRFVDAMIAIKAEADAVGRGEWDASDNPLVNAPHTAEAVIAGEWSHPYARELAVYPAPGQVRAKYWPPVRRIDQAYGDRNLMCECPPIEAFA